MTAVLITKGMRLNFQKKKKKKKIKVEILNFTLAKLLVIKVCDRLRIGQFSSKNHRNTNFRCFNERIGGNN